MISIGCRRAGAAATGRGFNSHQPDVIQLSAENVLLLRVAQ
jgi:hypothetical protein